MGKRENHSVKKQLLALGLAALMVSGNLEPVAAAQNTGAVVSDETETGELSGSKAQEAGNPASQDGKNVPGGGTDRSDLRYREYGFGKYRI